MNQWGRTKDLTVIGLGASELDDYVKAAAAEQNRTLRPDAEPEKGFYYRSDHFNFAKQGVPALDPDGGHRLRRQAGRLRQAEARRIHEQRLSRAVGRGEAGLGSDRRGEDAELFFAVGYRVANAAKFPEWRPGNEFKAKRDAMMKK